MARKDSSSLLRFPFLSYVQIFSCEISFIDTWNVHRVVFLHIFVFKLFLFCWFSCYLYCFWWVYSVFVRACVYNLQVFVSMHLHYLQCLQVLFLPLFLTHTICLWDVEPYASPLAFLFSGPFVQVLPSSTLKLIPIPHKRASLGVYPLDEIPAI